jgi:SAM-dependent methyltransferase
MEATEVRKLAEVEDRHWWYRERRYLLRQLIATCFPADLAGRVAIDVGSAGGGNTSEMTDLGLFAIPVEYGATGAGVARARGLPAVRGDGRCLPLRDCSVDLVVAFDVIEHIVEHERGLAEFHRVLRPGGSLLIAVPADMALWSAHDQAVGHVRRYSRVELAQLVRGSGFEITSLRAWNVLLRPVIAAVRRQSTGSDLSDVNRWLNALLGAIVALERRLPGLSSRRGVSLILSARKIA